MSFDPKLEWQVVTDDSIAPYRIEHGVDEIFNDGDLEQCYNFIDYHFQSDKAYMRGRSYLDENKFIALYGPFDSEKSDAVVDDEELYSLVIEYFSRRYSYIKILCSDGYKIIWQSAPCEEE